MDRNRGPIEVALTKDLDGLPGDVRGSGLAEAAIRLAWLLDFNGCEPCEACGCTGRHRVSGRDAPAIARELRETVAELRAAAGPPKVEDDVDEIAQRRAARRAQAQNPKPAPGGKQRRTRSRGTGGKRGTGP